MEPSFIDTIYSTIWPDDSQLVDAAETYSKLGPDQRFAYFYELMKSNDCLPVVEMVSTKSATKAAELKELGDSEFVRRNDAEAINLYTKSAAASLPDSVELASAYANRSASYYRLQIYAASLVDLNRALKGSYPSAMKPSLQQRKRNVVQKMQASSHVWLSYQTAVDMFRPIIPFEQAYRSRRQRESRGRFDKNLTELTYLHQFPVPYMIDMNPDLPNVNSKLRIRRNEKFGRHIIAVEEIMPGEVLGNEIPIASILSQNYAYTNCDACYLRCMAMMHCPTCSLVMFCSEFCREVAFSRYHRVECEILSLRKRFNIEDNTWLALRMLLNVTEQDVEKLKQLMQHATYQHPLNKDVSDITSAFQPENYANIHNMEDNYEKRSFENLNQFGFSAALLVQILKHSSFFNNKDESSGKKISTDLTSQESFVGLLLFKFLMVIQCNAFKIFETEDDDEEDINTPGTSSGPKPFKYVKKEIGSSIYVFHSLYNHSCDENVTRNFHKDIIVCRSIQRIHPGEQLFMNYGRSYYNYARKDRETYLRTNYQFKCGCLACKFDWPIMDDSMQAIVIKHKRRTLCSVESLKSFILENRELCKRNPAKFDKRMRMKLYNNLYVFQQNVKKPWKEYYDCQEKLRQIFAANGNFYSKREED